MNNGIGYTQVSTGGVTDYEVSTLNEGRVKIDGEYRHYDTPEQAEEAARKVAKDRKVKFVGEIR